MTLKNTIALSCALLILSISASLADDQQSEILHNNSYQDFKAASDTLCGIGSATYLSCTLIFVATPHINTVITAVSCSLNMPQGGQILYLQLGSFGNQANFNLPVVYTSYDQGYVLLTTTTPVQLFVKQGDTPKVFLATNGAAPDAFQCTISGYHS